MYECIAGHRFKEPEPLYDPGFGWIGVCPECGRDDFEEIERCAGCGAVFRAEEMESGFCPQCRAEVLREFQAGIANVFSKFNADEMRLLANEYWSVSLFESVSL